MSYTRAADNYLGDVSSQVYEYASRPGPAVFINTTDTNRRDDPHFAMWRMGAVVPPEVAAITAALDEAADCYPAFADAQATLVFDALGPSWQGAPDRSADAILAFIAKRRAGVALGQRSPTP